LVMTPIVFLLQFGSIRTLNTYFDFPLAWVAVLINVVLFDDLDVIKSNLFRYFNLTILSKDRGDTVEPVVVHRCKKDFKQVDTVAHLLKEVQDVLPVLRRRFEPLGCPIWLRCNQADLAKGKLRMQIDGLRHDCIVVVDMTVDFPTLLNALRQF